MPLTKRNRRFVRGTHVRQLRLEPLEDRRMLAVITVTNSIADNLFPGDGVSLREAILAANTNTSVDGSTAGDVGADTIRFDAALAGDTILLGGELEITETLTIDAAALAGGITIDSQQNSRVLNFSSTSGNLTLNGLTLTGGRTTGSNAFGGGIRFNSGGALALTSSKVSGNSSGDDGGGIWTYSGSVSLTSSTVSGNSTMGFFSSGGGIGTPLGSVSLTSTTVSGNSSSLSAGGIGTLSGSVSLTSSTVSGNSSGDDGGGIWTYSGSVSLTSSTVSGNVAGGAGGGVYVSNTITNPTFAIENSIVAGNTDNGTAPDLRPDPNSTRTINHSLIGATGLTIGGAGNLVGTVASPINPLLAPLANNGGPTQTHALLPGSPAIDQGDPNFNVPGTPFDQRGAPFARGVGTQVDIGAYERQTVAGLNLVVDTTADEIDGDYTAGDLSLREAVGLASGSVGADTVTFDAAVFATPQTILLGLGEIEIAEAVSIDGPGQQLLTIDAQQQSRIFNITAATGDVTLAGLTLTGGRTIGDNVNSSDTTFSGGAVRSVTSGSLILNQSTVSDNSTTGVYAAGGGMFSRRAITLTSSTVSGNSTAGQSAKGGGIYSSGAVTLSSSTVSGNSTTGFFAFGGGIHSFGASTLTNSTVSGNSTTGGFANGGGMITFGDVILASSTVTDNHAYDSDAYGGGIWNNNDPVSITNSIVAGNTAVGGMNDIRPGTPPLAALNINFSLIGTGVVPDAGTSGNNVVTNNPMLGVLADNGGPTQTHAPLAGSPTVDAGDPTALAGVGGVPMFDQRGMPFGRVEDGDGNMVARMDMGAFEVQPTTGPACDFDGMNGCNIDDIDAMVMEIVAGTNSSLYDLTDDGLVNLADRDQWLADAGALNLTSGNPYLLGDSNLDGVVDGQDFIVWNANKFVSTGTWSQADWNADGVTDGQDFIIWNGNKFQSSDGLLRSLLPSASHPAYEIAPTVDVQTEQQSPTRRLGLPQIIPSTNTKRIDAVFAAFHPREERADRQPQAYIFDALN